MNRPMGFSPLLGGCALLVLSSSLVGQRLEPPRYRPPNAPARAARVLDSIARLDQVAHSARRVLVDTTLGGVVWIAFEPTALPRAARAPAPRAAAASFLAQYGATVFGIGPAEANLELLAERPAGSLTHYRYGQRHAGYRVLDGQLTVHVAWSERGYVVQSANGWLFPDVTAPAMPAYSRRDAESAAIAGLARASVEPAADTAPVIVAHEAGYRLAYLVPVLDPTRAEVFTRYVDAETGAVFAETPTEETHTPAEATAVVQPPVPASGIARASSRAVGSAVTYVTLNGTDWQGDPRQFNAMQTGSTFELRDNSHPGASEVLIRSYGGASFLEACGDDRQVVQRALVNNAWPADGYGVEEVSAVHNLGETVSYWKNRFLRNGMWNDSVPVPLVACVHSTFDGFNAKYAPANHRLTFRQATGVDGPSVAAQDVATHEFTHGVNHNEINFSGSHFESRALNEALSDYFGARHRGTSCGAEGVIGTRPCGRQINSDSTLSQRYQACGSNYHCFGVVVSSALWATSQTPGYADETDYTVYYALRYYLTSVSTFSMASAAFDDAAQIRYDTDSSHGLYLRPILETQFGNREVFSFVVTASVPSYVTGCGNSGPLNGSSSHAADSWLWERDGGFLDDQQNSGFWVFCDPGASYPIDFVLTARRISNGMWASDTRTTYVILPGDPDEAPSWMDPSALAPSDSTPPGQAPGATQDIGPKRQNHHLRSGAWIGARAATGPTVAQLLALGGPQKAAGPVWPNAFGGDRETVQEARAPRSGPRARAVFTRLPLPEGPQAYRARFAPATRDISHAFVGLALDPDLGVRPGDETLGLDTESGLIWVTDPDSGALGYLVTDVPSGARVTVRQFSTRKDAWHPDPVGDSAAYAELSAGEAALTGKSGDVRFLIAIGPVDPLAQTLDVGLVMLTAPSLAALREQARSAPRAVLALFADDGPASASKTGIARFRLMQAPPEAGAAAGVRPISLALAPGLVAPTGANAPPAGEVSALRDAVRRYGITALAFAVPDGAPAHVTIRVYDPSGRILRTLIRETYDPGAYRLQWDLKDERGTGVAPGVYIAVMEAQGFRAMTKLVVVP